jgi:hypothetical protein
VAINNQNNSGKHKAPQIRVYFDGESFNSSSKHRFSMPTVGSPALRLVIHFILLCLSTMFAVLFLGLVFSDVVFGFALELGRFGLTEFSSFFSTFPWVSIVSGAVFSGLSILFSFKVIRSLQYYFPSLQRKTAHYSVAILILFFGVGALLSNTTAVDNKVRNTFSFDELETFRQFAINNILVGTIVSVDGDKVTVVDENGNETTVVLSGDALESFLESGAAPGDKIAVVTSSPKSNSVDKPVAVNPEIPDITNPDDPDDADPNTPPPPPPPPTLLGVFVDTSNSSASDSNPGTENSPYKTIAKAISVANAGDTIYVKAGTYTEAALSKNAIHITKSGQSGNPIVISAYPGDKHKAIIDGGGFFIDRASHIEIRDFKIQNAQNSDNRRYGVRVIGSDDPSNTPATDIVIDGNWTYNTQSSGISVWGVAGRQPVGDLNNIRNITITNNKIERCTEGGSNECITVANGVYNVEVGHNELLNNRMSDPSKGAEGIDLKEGVINGTIHHNTIHDFVDNAIYLDGGGYWIEEGFNYAVPVIRNIDIYSNYIYDADKTGIYVVNEGPSIVEDINIYNNVINGIKNSGIQFYHHPDAPDGSTATIRDINVYNNTIYGITEQHGININHRFIENLVIRNNISWGNAKRDIIDTNDRATIVNNLCDESECEFRTDPLLTGAQLQLLSGSPAINSGTSFGSINIDFFGNSRPNAGGYDLGAHEL